MTNSINQTRNEYTPEVIIPDNIGLSKDEQVWIQDVELENGDVDFMILLPEKMIGDIYKAAAELGIDANDALELTALEIEQAELNRREANLQR